MTAITGFVAGGEIGLDGRPGLRFLRPDPGQSPMTVGSSASLRR